MVLIAPSAPALQVLVNICKTYVSQNELQLNNRKSKYMVFKNDLVKDFDCPKIFIDNDAIDLYNCVDYLGMLIRDDLSDEDSILNSIKGIYARGNLITKHFRNCSKEVKVKLFLSY